MILAQSPILLGLVPAVVVGIGVSIYNALSEVGKLQKKHKLRVANYLIPVLTIKFCHKTKMPLMRDLVPYQRPQRFLASQ
jgi:hypothetical protein